MNEVQWRYFTMMLDGVLTEQRETRIVLEEIRDLLAQLGEAQNEESKAIFVAQVP